MSLRDLYDVAWSMIYDDVPGGFTNPYEYKQTMYQMFFEGRMPEAAQKANAANKVKDANARVKAARDAKKSGATPPAVGSGDPALRQLMALRERAARLREERKT